MLFKLILCVSFSPVDFEMDSDLQSELQKISFLCSPRMFDMLISGRSSHQTIKWLLKLSENKPLLM